MVRVYRFAIHIAYVAVLDIDDLAVATTLDALLGFIMMEFA